jgi:hypothetical protein
VRGLHPLLIQRLWKDEQHQYEVNERAGNSDPKHARYDALAIPFKRRVERVLDKPPAYSGAQGGAEVEDAGKAAEDLSAGAGGGAVTEVYGGRGLKGGPTP